MATTNDALFAFTDEMQWGDMLRDRVLFGLKVCSFSTALSERWRFGHTVGLLKLVECFRLVSFFRNSRANGLCLKLLFQFLEVCILLLQDSIDLMDP